MVQRRERLKKQLLRNQMEAIELEAASMLEFGGDTCLGLEGAEEKDEGEELESVDDDDDDPCSPPSVRQTR